MAALAAGWRSPYLSLSRTRKRRADMKIGVIGSGVVAQVLGAGFLKHGHEVAMGTRDPPGRWARCACGQAWTS